MSWHVQRRCTKTLNTYYKRVEKELPCAFPFAVFDTMCVDHKTLPHIICLLDEHVNIDRYFESSARTE